MADTSSSCGDDIVRETRADSYEAIGSIKMGWYRVDREGTCAYWSSGAQKILGWEEREIVGQDLHSVIHENESVRYTLTLPYAIDIHVLHVTPSIGVRVLAMEHSNTQEVVQEADLAMYQAKSSGGNCVRCYEPKMKHRFRRTYELEQDLRIAIKHGEIQLYYQGQFDHQGRLVGAEVLSRWMRKGVMVSLSEFIPIAEQTGLITDLGMFVLRHALQQLHNWNRRKVRLLKLSINMSVHQFRAPDFVNQMKRVIQETQVDARWIVLEMTESVLMEDADETRRKLESLRAIGVEISIDDFGTGFSSLAYLNRLPIHELKIDRQFTTQIVSSSSEHSIVKAIMGIGQSLALRVVAEGVETKEQQEGLFLISNGV